MNIIQKTGKGKMKIGVFDSGLGGLITFKGLVKELPQYDFIYLGDTERLPYGNRSSSIVSKFLEEGVEYLFKKDCALIIVACNTASSEALRNIQHTYLPKHYPDRRVLGVIVPTAEVVASNPLIKKIGILATTGTVESENYVHEISKINPRLKIYQQAAPLLVPLIEYGGMKYGEPLLEQYLAPLLIKRVDAIILGCTHYPILKKEIRKMTDIPIICQDEIIPKKVKNYLARHQEIDSRLAKSGKREFLVTDITKNFTEIAHKWFGKGISLQKVSISPEK